jgi:glycosyltransferase involved in cell wall biosynthesis
MRITSVITRSDVVGGASLHVADVAVGLAGRGHDVEVLVGGDGPYLDVLAARGVEWRRVPSLVRAPDPRRDVRAIAALRAELRRFGPDVVTAHTSKAGALARLAAWSLGIPATYTPHDFAFGPAYPGLQGAAYATVERLLARVPRTVVVDVSAEERQRALARRVGAPERHVVVHNGIADVDPRGAPSRGTPRPGCSSWPATNRRRTNGRSCWRWTGCATSTGRAASSARATASTRRAPTSRPTISTTACR